ncbi:MAG: hypothetical protein AAF602_09705 [Myxococcota bacterium]
MGSRMVAALVVLVGCGTEIGNPEGDVTVLYNARSQVPEVSLEPGAPGTTVSAVWLRLESVALTRACKSDQVEAVALDPLGLADHAGDEPFLQEPRIPDGPYCSLVTGFVPGNDGPNELTRGASMALEGTLADGRPFTVIVDEPVGLALDLDNVPRPEKDEGAWLISFDVGTWIDPAELSGLSGDRVVVSAGSNVDVYDAMVARIADGVQLHLDRGFDGSIDDGDTRLDLP